MMDSKYKMKVDIERIFINLIARMGMDIPENYEDIVQYIYEEVLETADSINWGKAMFTKAFLDCKNAF